MQSHLRFEILKSAKRKIPVREENAEFDERFMQSDIFLVISTFDTPISMN